MHGGGPGELDPLRNRPLERHRADRHSHLSNIAEAGDRIELVCRQPRLHAVADANFDTAAVCAEIGGRRRLRAPEQHLNLHAPVDGVNQSGGSGRHDPAGLSSSRYRAQGPGKVVRQPSRSCHRRH